MPEADKIADIASLEKAVITATSKFGEDSDIWWRGHSVASWDLVPKVYRLGREVDEHNLAFAFIHSARSRYIKCPDSGDWPSWLFLMQHYGLPTRLLDWSKSALVALFFSVGEPALDEQSGALWAIQPGKLNKDQINRDSLIAVHNKFAKDICEEAFDEVPRKKLKVTIAVPTDQFDVRHLVQASVFTVHATNVPINTPIKAGEYLQKFEVPSSAKKSLRIMLSKLGMNAANLFPDLEHLARHVTSLSFRRPDV